MDMEDFPPPPPESKVNKSSYFICDLHVSASWMLKLVNMVESVVFMGRLAQLVSSILCT